MGKNESAYRAGLQLEREGEKRDRWGKARCCGGVTPRSNRDVLQRGLARFVARYKKSSAGRFRGRGSNNGGRRWYKDLARRHI